MQSTQWIHNSVTYNNILPHITVLLDTAMLGMISFWTPNHSRALVTKKMEEWILKIHTKNQEGSLWWWNSNSNSNSLQEEKGGALLYVCDY